jgi:DNA-binding NarL/FixJ family response regulator
MLCDIVENIVAEQPDMEVVGKLERRTSLLTAAAEAAADVVILGLGDAELPLVCEELVAAQPHSKVLAVAADGRRAFLYELRPQTSALGEISPQGLIDAIRAAVGHGVS